MQNLITNLSNVINPDLVIPIISKEITLNEIKNESGCQKVILKLIMKSICIRKFQGLSFASLASLASFALFFLVC